jgi:putative flavoprotein involved in K+ transport
MMRGTVIVGAGPAGLAVAAALGQGGVLYEVLERAPSIGSSWSTRYDSLQLHTGRWLSGLPGAPIPRAAGSWVRRDDFVAYLEDYARRFDIVPTLNTTLLRVDREQKGWRLETSNATRHAERVILATGYSSRPFIPDWPGRESFTGLLLHSVEYREPSRYRGRRVLVVGAGNSAADIAVELSAVAGEVLMAVRTPPNIVPRDTLGVPSQLLGIALRGVPETAMNRVTTVLRRLTVPDLSGLGLPAPPGNGYTQFLRSRSVPILDHGFVDAVRRGAIRVVPGVASLHRGRSTSGRRSGTTPRRGDSGDGLPPRLGTSGRPPRRAGRARRAANSWRTHANSSTRALLCRDLRPASWAAPRNRTGGTSSRGGHQSGTRQ